MRLKSIFLLPIACAAIMSALVMAQQATGVVTGAVLDPNGNPVTNFADGNIQVTNTATAAKRRHPVVRDVFENRRCDI